MGVLAPDLAVDLGLSATMLGAASSAYFFAYAAMQIPTGVMLDRFGARRAMTVLFGFAALGVAWFALARSDVEVIAEKIKDLSGGATLTQLYFDWGIMRPPRELGGNPTLQKWLTENHPRVTARTPDDLSEKLRREWDAYIEEENRKAVEEMGPNGENIYHEMAARVWNEADRKLYELMRGRELYTFLDRHEMQTIAETLQDYANDLKDILKH
jgi:hypothetical protein